MDGRRARKFEIRLSIRAAGLIGAAGVLALIVGVWQHRQHVEIRRMMADARSAAAQAQADANRGRRRDWQQPLTDGAVVRASRRDPKGDERVRQLYREIEQLTNIDGRLRGEIQRIQTTARKLTDGKKLAPPGGPPLNSTPRPSLDSLE